MNGFRLELAKCSANPSCAANVACLHTCNKGPDEIECQVSYVLSLEMLADTAERIWQRVASLLDQTNPPLCQLKLLSSWLSNNLVVPYTCLMFGDSVPNPAFLVKNFNVANFVGKWFVTSGLFTRSTVQRNDAWDVVYTRSAVLPESIVLELEMATRRDFNKFISTDNKGS
ncbi:hypothetical protein POTOM_058029 [Populus tomentosa]|uniref:VDE lipocalin domain-containing protein n=1 Tax=Populus tomentosa TaxID=118781 RepID=A0A8X7XQA7_POPTO|nr:hypothetical protein POTOM_058029 [Populus tomentosa]